MEIIKYIKNAALIAASCFVLNCGSDSDDKVLPQNNPPVIEDIQIYHARAGEILSGYIVANDPDGDELSYNIGYSSLEDVWADLDGGIHTDRLLDSSDGNIEHMLRVDVSDGKDTTYGFRIFEVNPNYCPAIETVEDLVAKEGEILSGRIIASDLEGDELAYGVVMVTEPFPALEIDPLTGEFYSLEPLVGLANVEGLLRLDVSDYSCTRFAFVIFEVEP